MKFGLLRMVIPLHGFVDVLMSEKPAAFAAIADVPRSKTED